jgi:hypothetical protein
MIERYLLTDYDDGLTYTKYGRYIYTKIKDEKWLFFKTKRQIQSQTRQDLSTKIWIEKGAGAGLLANIIVFLGTGAALKTFGNIGLIVRFCWLFARPGQYKSNESSQNTIFPISKECQLIICKVFLSGVPSSGTVQWS